MSVPKDSEFRLVGSDQTKRFGTPAPFDTQYFPYADGPFTVEYSVKTESSLYRTISGVTNECLDLTADMAESSLYCSITEAGTVIARTGSRVWLLTPGHVAVSIGPLRTTARLSRGKHIWHTIVVNKEDNRGIMSDPTMIKRLEESGGIYLVSDQEVEKTFGLSSFIQLHKDSAHKGSAAVSTLASMILATEQCKERSPLASPDMKVGHVFEELLKEVFEAPQRPWTLAQASALVGYSPFHFSRTFRAAVGFGFPEYVDRCRAQRVMFDLLETDTPVDQLAGDYGYGSASTLRQALKEYTGFLPSEFRLAALV